MAGDFAERIRELQERVGDGTLRGKVEVDQVYARYQHEGLDFKHPRGGQAKYLEQPWLSEAENRVRTVAKTVLEPGGPQDGMRDVVEGGAEDVKTHAPVEFDDLRRSGHPSVEDDGVVVYDRPPEVPRLSEDELRAKSRLRSLGYANNVRRGRDGISG